MTDVTIEYQKSNVSITPENNEISVAIDNKATVVSTVSVGLSTIEITGGGVSLDPGNALTEGNDGGVFLSINSLNPLP